MTITLAMLTEFVKAWGALITALGVLVSMFLTRRKEEHDRKEGQQSRLESCLNIEKTLQILEEGQREINKNILCLTVANNAAPPSVRDRAYHAYKALGGNGWCDRYYEQTVKPLIDHAYDSTL